MRIAAGEHWLEGEPEGVQLDRRTRELDVGDLPAGGRYPVRLVARENDVEVSVPMTIAATGEPKRRRNTAQPAKKAK